MLDLTGVLALVLSRHAVFVELLLRQSGGSRSERLDMGQTCPILGVAPMGAQGRAETWPGPLFADPWLRFRGATCTSHSSCNPTNEQDCLWKMED